MDWTTRGLFLQQALWVRPFHQPGLIRTASSPRFLSPWLVNNHPADTLAALELRILELQRAYQQPYLLRKSIQLQLGMGFRDLLVGALVMVETNFESMVFESPFLINISSIGERQFVGGLSNLIGLPLIFLSP